jgi:copper/silver efflux system protein
MADTDSKREPETLIQRVIDFCGRNRFFVYLFAVCLTAFGAWTARHTPLDALPDLSDTQVIIATEWMGRNPTLIEDQVTYPIATTFLGVPKVKTVRGFTMFGMSFVYVIFQDGTDLYWARSRVVEYLSKVREKLPAGANPQIGPDATSVGWVYQYALVDRSGKQNLQELRSLQDWTLRYSLQSVEGVAEVASVGGFEKQYLVEIDPVKMKAFALSVVAANLRVRCAAATPRLVGAWSKWRSTSTPFVDGATSATRTTSKERSLGPTSKARPSALVMSPPFQSAGTSGVVWWTWMGKGKWSAALS